MKGPSGHARYQTRRSWKCSKCGRSRLTAGSVTVLACDQCNVEAGQPVIWMELLEAPKKAITPPKVASTDQGEGQAASVNV